MDKDNKYYSLIESLVKKHKKFPGYEAILEDIIDDVYSHSEVIINSINNDDVVQSYLEKVISTSIIVVPKKLNFNTRVPHRVITSQVVSNNISLEEPAKAEPIPVKEDIDDSEVKLVEQEPVNDDIVSFTENLPTEKANPKFVDQMINTMNADLVDLPEQTDAEILTEVDELAVIEEDETVLEQELPTVQSEEILVPDSIISDDSTVNDNIVEEISTQSEFEELAEQDFSEQETIQEQETLSVSEENLFDDTDENEDSGIDSALSIDDNNYEIDNNILINESIEVDNDDLREDSDSVDLIAHEVENDEVIDNDNVLLTDIDKVGDVSKLDILDDNYENTELGDDAIELDIDNNETDGLVIQDESTVSGIVPEVEDLSIEAEQDIDIIGDGISENIVEDSDFTSDNLLESSDDLSEVTTEDVLVEDSVQDDSDELVSFDSDNDNLVIEDESLDISEEKLSDEDETFDLQPSYEDVDNSDLIQNESLKDNYDLLQSEEDSDDNLLIDFGLEKKENDLSHKNLDYSVFNYNPENVRSAIDAQQISDKLLKLNSNEPQSNVLKIFDLRYKQNYTLEKIASELNITTDDVVIILNKIVELV